MKNTVFIFFLISINNYAQNSTDIKETFPVFPVCELLPEKFHQDCFNETVDEHIQNNFVYPKQAWDNDLEAMVKVKFDIDINGTIKNITPNSSVIGVSFFDRESLNLAKKLFNDSAKKVIESLPDAIPAKKGNIAIKKTFLVSIKYQIPRKLGFDDVDSPPIFELCSDKENKKLCFIKFIEDHISKNFKYPKRAIKKGEEGNVFIQFDMTSDGLYTNFTTIGENRILEDEAYRIMIKLPSFEPAKYRDKYVTTTYGTTISFKLNQ
tara:strand:+ start:2632 stop:3426 length:795 start_codon:yes stop_codon:yes gene_type:complete